MGENANHLSDHRPRKRFGQNFLRDRRVIDRIVSAVRPELGQHIVEIGPGQGAITEQLAASSAQLSIVEIDRDLAAKLPASAWWRDDIQLYQQDALKTDWLSFNPLPLRIVGNLPYNISTPLLFSMLDAADAIFDMHLMLQKEVVQRLCAKPGTSAWGRLSVATQLRADPTVLIDVPPGCFYPPPKVQSQVVRLIPKRPAPKLPDSLDTLLRAGFAARRKTLRKALLSQVTPSIWQDTEIDPSLRAEVLSLEDWLRLGSAVDNST